MKNPYKTTLLIIIIPVFYLAIYIFVYPGLGAAIYPLLLVPILLVTRLKGISVGLVYTTFLVFAPFLILNPLLGITYDEQRIQALLIGAVWLYGTLLIISWWQKDEMDTRRRMAEGVDQDTHYRSLFHNSVIPIAIYDHQGCILDINDLAAANMNSVPAALIGKKIGEILPNDTTSQFLKRLAYVFEKGQGFIREEPIQLIDETRWFLTNTQPIYNAQKRVKAVLVVAQDITQQKKAEIAYRQSEKRWQFAWEGNREGVWDWDNETGEVFFNDHWKTMLGFSVDEVANTHESWRSLVHPEDWPLVQETLERHIAGDMAEYRSEYRLRTKDGKYKWVYAHGKVIERTPDGRPVRMIGTHTDLTERKRTESLILNVARGVSTATGSNFFRSLVLYLGNILQADTVFVGELINDEVQRIQTVAVFKQGKIANNFRYDLENSPCKNVVGHQICIYPRQVQQRFPKDHGLVEQNIESYIGAPLSSSDNIPMGLIVVMFQQPLKNIETVKSLLQIFAIRAAGELERLDAEALLKTNEAKLQQAQRMEAIGRLAGGIAHDFNNILTVIISYSDMLARSYPEPDHPVNLPATQINEAGQRAAHITQQLLAFSRRQELAPAHFNLNIAVERMVDMLEHLIGEHIELKMRLQDDLWHAHVDPSQLEQVIMNLVINGRDAMPNGGELIIQTENKIITQSNRESSIQPEIPAGSYALMSVSDTGFGISEDTLAHIFEPFFTTKDLYQGTGLGLATVYGIVSQSGGYVQVDSALNKGTVFHLLFPKAKEPIPHPEMDLGFTQTISGSETILLVEDDESVQYLTGEILNQKGYRLLTAPAGEAVALAQQYTGRIDMLLTDVVMPELSGPALAQQFMKIWPEIRILYMSGYTKDIMRLHGLDPEANDLIQKPFAPETLLRKVRDVLDKVLIR